MIYTRDRPLGSGQEASCSICLTACEQLRGASLRTHSRSANTTLLAGQIKPGCSQGSRNYICPGAGKGPGNFPTHKGGQVCHTAPAPQQHNPWAPSKHTASTPGISKSLPKQKRLFYFKSIQKKKKKSRSLVSHKEGKGRGEKRSRVKHETLLEGVLWYKGTIQYERITYVQPCQQHGARCSVQSGAWHPHQGLQTESAVPGEGPGGEAAVAAVGGPP